MNGFYDRVFWSNDVTIYRSFIGALGSYLGKPRRALESKIALECDSSAALIKPSLTVPHLLYIPMYYYVFYLRQHARDLSSEASSSCAFRQISPSRVGAFRCQERPPVGIGQEIKLARGVRELELCRATGTGRMAAPRGSGVGGRLTVRFSYVRPKSLTSSCYVPILGPGFTVPGAVRPVTKSS